MAGQAYFDDFRAGDVVAAASHGCGDVDTAGADGDHAETAAGWRVAVGTDQGFTWDAEVFQMDLVADAVAWTAVGDAEVFGSTLDEEMVVKIFRAALQHVVVDVGHGAFGFYTVDAHGFQLEIRHRTGGILGEGLVNAQTDLVAWFHFTIGEMGSEDLFC